MSAQRADQLRTWHERVVGGRRQETITVAHLGLRFVVPPDVYPPNPNGLAELVAAEVRAADRVLDLGTGSGINGIVAAATSTDVVAVDISPSAVSAARSNAERNGVTARVRVLEGDLFEAIGGTFDLIVFDPPFRWFRPRDMRERSTTDENYQSLTSFFHEAKNYLNPDGRILLSFGTTGDIDYLHHLITEADLDVDVLREVRAHIDGQDVAYFAYRLTPRKQVVAAGY